MTTINFVEHLLFRSLTHTLEHLIHAEVKTRHLDSITVWQNSVRIHTVQYTFQCKLLAGLGTKNSNDRLLSLSRGLVQVQTRISHTNHYLDYVPRPDTSQVLLHTVHAASI